MENKCCEATLSFKLCDELAMRWLRLSVFRRSLELRAVKYPGRLFNYYDTLAAAWKSVLPVFASFWFAELPYRKSKGSAH